MSSYGEVFASQIASVIPNPVIMQNAATGNGDGTTLVTTGYATAVLSTTASVPMSGGTTINFEASTDGITWVPIIGTQVGTTTTATSTTDIGDWMFNVAGYNNLRARISAYSAGTITTKGYVAVVAGANAGGGGGGASLGVNVSQINGVSPAMGNGATNTGTQRVTIASDSTGQVAVAATVMPSAVIMQNAATGNGNGTTLVTTGYATAVLSTTASVPMSGGTTINFEASTDGTTWVPIIGTQVGTTTTATSTTAAGDWVFNVAGYNNLRARISAYSAGTITTNGYVAVVSGGGGAGGGGGGGGDVNISQINGVTPAMGNGTTNTGTQRVTLSSDSTGQVALAAGTNTIGNIANVSGTISLPIGAATAAKQPALGTAGSASSDVITVQGIASMTALKVDGSGATQPVSGTVTANAGTNLNTSALALESGGNLAAIAGAVSSARMQVQQNATIMPSAVTMQNAATGNGNGTTLTTTGYATAVLSTTASVPMSGGTTINFEASTDGTTWVPIIGTQVGTTTTATSTTAVGDWVFNVAGYNNLRARISAYSTGTITTKGYVAVVSGAGGAGGGGGGGSNVNISQINGVSPATGNGTTNTGTQRVTISSDSTGQIAVNTVPNTVATYSANTNGAFTPLASATDMIVFSGSSTKTIKIMGIWINYEVGAAPVYNQFYIVKRSTANSGGTVTTETIVPLDSSDATSTATLQSYRSGSNPTLGTAVGTVWYGSLFAATNASGYDYGTQNGITQVYQAPEYGQPLTLHGTSESICLNNNGVTVAGSSPRVGMLVIYTEQ